MYTKDEILNELENELKEIDQAKSEYLEQITKEGLNIRRRRDIRIELDKQETRIYNKIAAIFNYKPFTTNIECPIFARSPRGERVS